MLAVDLDHPLDGDASARAAVVDDGHELSPWRCPWTASPALVALRVLRHWTGSSVPGSSADKDAPAKTNYGSVQSAPVPTDSAGVGRGRRWAAPSRRRARWSQSAGTVTLRG